MDPMAGAGAQLLEKGILGTIIFVLLFTVGYLFRENRAQARESKEEVKNLYEMLRTKSENYTEHVMQLADAVARAKRRDTKLPPP